MMGSLAPPSSSRASDRTVEPSNRTVEPFHDAEKPVKNTKKGKITPKSAKTAFISQQDTDFLVWHDQFTADRSGGVMENWNDAPQRFLPINPPLHHSINPFLPTVALGN